MSMVAMLVVWKVDQTVEPKVVHWAVTMVALMAVR